MWNSTAILDNKKRSIIGINNVVFSSQSLKMKEWTGIRPVNRKKNSEICANHIQAFTSLKKKITDCLIYCILGNGEVIKYLKFISVVDIELSVRCLNESLSKFVKILVRFISYENR